MANKVIATILFVDIMNSMEIANYWAPKKYNDFLNEFQRLMQHGISLWRKGIKQIKLAGDELVVFYCSKDVTWDIVNAISLANTLKLMWYAGKPNRERVNEGKKILDLGVGINTGYVTYEYRPVLDDFKRYIRKRKTFEGLPISLAKRIESFSRKGKYSRIMLGNQTVAELNKTYHWYEYEPMGLQRFKGMSQEVPVFELKSCYTLEAEIFGESKEFNWEIRQLERIKISDPSNIWLLMTLIDIYGCKKKYKKVEKLCREALAIEDGVSNIHHELGEALEKQKKYNEALNHFDKAISLRWDSWVSYIGKSSCLIFLGQYDECIKMSEKIIPAIPTWLAKQYRHTLYYNMAAAYARKGDKRRALANIKKAVKLGGREVVTYLKKDKDKDFFNLYENAEFKQICKGMRKTKTSKRKK
ncbi:MAG: tetratricopeptide repeat protein [Sedimentisphaerales bacterium]|nr:tetratricopeptide repeat protein [Sedimentisphaerales bacterium]